MEQNTEVTREGLKILALTERISQLVSEVADLRVEVTVVANEYQKKVDELEAQLLSYKNAEAQEGVDEPDVVS